MFNSDGCSSPKTRANTSRFLSKLQWPFLKTDSRSCRKFEHKHVLVELLGFNWILELPRPNHGTHNGPRIEIVVCP